MSKKKLSKTVIEGGRSNHNKWSRRNSHSEERASERDYCQRVTKDPECSDDEYIIEKNTVHKDFKDKLGPMYRWLHQQVGKKWDDVYSEIREKFDVRTTPGRHIVFDHLLNSVELPNDPYRLSYGRSKFYPDDTTSFYKNDYYVNEDGILCHKTYIPKYKRVFFPKFDTGKIASWLSGRTIGKKGNKLFWFVPTDKSQWKIEWGYNKAYYYSDYGIHYYYLYYGKEYSKDKDGKVIITVSKPVWSESTPNFRQDRKLNNKELQFWNTIPEYYQHKVLEFSPVNPEFKKKIS